MLRETTGRPGPGQRWILDRGLREGGPSTPPFWHTPEESCKGLGSVTLKYKHSTTNRTRTVTADLVTVAPSRAWPGDLKNKQSTHTSLEDTGTIHFNFYTSIWST